MDGLNLLDQRIPAILTILPAVTTTTNNPHIVVITSIQFHARSRMFEIVVEGACSLYLLRAEISAVLAVPSTPLDEFPLEDYIDVLVERVAVRTNDEESSLHSHVLVSWMYHVVIPIEVSVDRRRRREGIVEDHRHARARSLRHDRRSPIVPSSLVSSFLLLLAWRGTDRPTVSISASLGRGVPRSDNPPTCTSTT